MCILVNTNVITIRFLMNSPTLPKLPTKLSLLQRLQRSVLPNRAYILVTLDIRQQRSVGIALIPEDVDLGAFKTAVGNGQMDKANLMLGEIKDQPTTINGYYYNNAELVEVIEGVGSEVVQIHASAPTVNAKESQVCYEWN